MYGALSLPVSAAEGKEPDPAAWLLEGLTACAEVIDLSGAGLPVSALGSVYMKLLHSHPALFHVAPRLSYGYTETTVGGVLVRTVTEVYPVYLLTGAELTAARALYRDTVAGLLTEMETVFGNAPRAEAETVLYLHDLLADRYAYDTRPTGANADAYTFFRDGRGICQAYALAFLALCEGAGLEADLVISDAMDHAWNHVRVDGVWYHVDVTRDDPVPAREGGDEVNHTRLLRSDEGMNALGYHGYSCAAGHTCSDTRYETATGAGALAAFRSAMTPWRGKWIGVDAADGIVGVTFQENGLFVGKVGDVNMDGCTDPMDLLTLYDPFAPEAWRKMLREALVNPAEAEPGGSE